jgi:hypothetical protein
MELVRSTANVVLDNSAKFHSGRKVDPLLCSNVRSMLLKGAERLDERGRDRMLRAGVPKEEVPRGRSTGRLPGQKESGARPVHDRRSDQRARTVRQGHHRQPEPPSLARWSAEILSHHHRRVERPHRRNELLRQAGQGERDERSPHSRTTHCPSCSAPAESLGRSPSKHPSCHGSVPTKTGRASNPRVKRGGQNAPRIVAEIEGLLDGRLCRRGGTDPAGACWSNGPDKTPCDPVVEAQSALVKRGGTRYSRSTLWPR